MSGKWIHKYFGHFERPDIQEAIRGQDNFFFGKKEFVFKPYDGNKLKEILKARGRFDSRLRIIQKKGRYVTFFKHDCFIFSN